MIWVISWPLPPQIFDCLCGLEKAVALGHFSLLNFDVAEYEHLDNIANGDMSWIVPNKFLAFSGPLPR
jgi:cell division cycle 14